jgi:hypothetical protein
MCWYTLVTLHLELYIDPIVSNCCFEVAKHKYRYTKIKIIRHSHNFVNAFGGNFKYRNEFSLNYGD